MKLLRYGTPKSERPGMLDEEGILRDLSSHVSDIAADALSPEGLAKLRSLDPKTLPRVSGTPRIGPCVGGVGKTRLAIELAHQMPGIFARDICLVELAGLNDESAVEDAVAAALHLPTSTGRSSISSILDYLRDKTLLLVLDNCEHLAKACSRLVKTLAQDAARLTVLATSRIPLNLPEEHVIRLEPFATPSIDEAKELTAADALSFAAIQLFAYRAAQSLLPFRLTESNVLSVVLICQQLDCIPLSIVIAAAQTRVLPIEAIAERLSQRFTWLNKQSP